MRGAPPAVREGVELRLLLLRGLIALAALVLIGRLWQVQMVTGEQYRLLSDQNRLREVDVPAPRGVIYDRNGEILARNRPSFTVVLIPGDLPLDPGDESGGLVGENKARGVIIDRLLGILAEPVPDLRATPGVTPTTTGVTPTPTPSPTPVKKGQKPGPTPTPVIAIAERQPWIMPRDEIEQQIKDGLRGGAYRPVTIARYVKEATAFRIAEDAVNLQGVELVLEPIRDYPDGSLTSHMIGYMGHIPEAERKDYEDQGYNQNEQVGLAGLESWYEKELRGGPGRQTIEVDVHGRRIRTVGEEQAAIPGANLVLSLDRELQRVATEALQESLSASSGFTKATQGVVVALNPRNGKVLAFVSLPSYDNNLFTKGITDEGWTALTTDPDLPLFNRATGGQFPPGSIFKIIVASGGLESGTITPRTLLGDGFDGRNDGIIWLPNEFFPWDMSLAQPFYSWIHKYGYGYGLISVRDALSVSDDIYFYELGGGYRDRFQGMGSKNIGKYAREFGLGAPTGIDLPGEMKGLVPDSKWKRLNYAENWLTGDTYNESIGQGYVLATPLQMANATAAVANRGKLWKPQLVDYMTDAEGQVVKPFEPQLIRDVAVDPSYLDVVREGMYGAINWPRGTAPHVKVPGVAIAGKTGTAEFFRDDNKDNQPDRDDHGNLPTHAWFTAFAPYVDPEIVVTVFVSNGGEGSGVAAPIATKILNAYFEMNPPAEAAAKK
jgi:penicillin-binding protein 2